MNTTQVSHWRTVNTSDIRFHLGAILDELQTQKSPFLVISRSRPRAWLYPYEENVNAKDLFIRWQKQALPKYQRIKAKDLITLIRQDRDNRQDETSSS